MISDWSVFIPTDNLNILVINYFLDPNLLILSALPKYVADRQMCVMKHEVP